MDNQSPKVINGCPTCGHPWSEQSDTCSECGTPLPTGQADLPAASGHLALALEQPEAKAPEVPPISVEQVSVRVPRWSWKRLLPGVLATLLLACLGLVSRYMFLNTAPGALESLVLEGHRLKVYALAYTPDGRWLISSGGSRDPGGDHGIKVWQANTGQLAQVLEGHTAAVRALAVSPDGNWLASAGLDGYLRLWSTQNWKPVQTLDTGKVPLYTAAFSPDGIWLVWAGDDRSIRRWHTRDRRTAPALAGHNNSLITLAFSPDGNFLASAGEDRTIRMWDTRTWKTTYTLNDPQEAVWSLAFSPDNQKLASGGEGSELWVWDLATRKPHKRLLSDEGGRDRGVRAIAFSPDGSRLATGNFDGSVKVWETTAYRLILSYQENRNRVYAVAFSPNGRWLAAGGGNEWGAVDYAIRLWPLGLP